MPQYLIVHINRFEDNGDQSYKKVRKPIEYPISLDMDE